MRLAILLLPLLLAGCYLSRSADLPDELERTWDGATVAVPFSAVEKLGDGGTGWLGWSVWLGGSLPQ